MSKKLGLIHSNKNSTYNSMNQCHGKFKKGRTRKFKVNASILRCLHIFQTMRSWKYHRDHLKTNASMIHKVIFDDMWLNAFNYINLHDFAFIYFTYLNIYNINKTRYSIND